MGHNRDHISRLVEGMSLHFLADLNPVQKEAVCHEKGPLLILAGAGSGKTRVLTYRIARLLSDGVPPEDILAVTFTNKAAGEMRTRVGRLVGPGADRVWIGTFHATCARILRRDGRETGIPPGFAIYDSQDQVAAVKEALAKADLSEKNFPPRAVLAAISAAKNALIGPEDYRRGAADFWTETVARIYPVYQEILRRCQALDFDDLIGEAVRLFAQKPEVLRRYQERWRHVLIDEYQDTNHAQYELVRALAQKYRQICVVGDDDQSIYGFRQADVRNILEFERDYPEARVIKLEQNYRSTGNILAAANAVILHNQSRKAKTLWTENPAGGPLIVQRAFDEREEARFVVDEIQLLAGEEGRGYADFAILYRTNAQSRPLEESLIQRGVPYRIVGGLRFYERREIRDILAYLRLLNNPADAVSFRRVAGLQRGMGEATVGRVIDAALERGTDLLTAAAGADELPRTAGRAREALGKLVGLYARAAAMNATVLELTKFFLEETGYLKDLRAEGTPEAEARLENLQEFLALTAQFQEESDDPGLAAFLEAVSLVAEADAYDAAADAVVLMTLHAAKGLEFPVVFMVGLEEGIFPHARATEEGEIEEERRLCYVGITRAKERLYLTHANSRILYGDSVPSLPSRFLREIPASLTAPAVRPETRESVAAAPGPARSAIMPRIGVFRAGDKVTHPMWGPGVVVECRGGGEDAIVTVAFPGLGVKQLAVAYAGLAREN